MMKPGMNEEMKKLYGNNAAYGKTAKRKIKKKPLSSTLSPDVSVVAKTSMMKKGMKSYG